MADTFDPDAYLAEKKAAVVDSGFDPDAYLAEKKAPTDKMLPFIMAHQGEDQKPKVIPGTNFTVHLPEDPDFVNPAEAAVRGADQGLLRVPSRLDSAGDATMDKIREFLGGPKKDFGSEYSKNLKQHDDLNKIAAEKQPVAHFLGDVGGTMAVSMAVNPLLGAAGEAITGAKAAKAAMTAEELAAAAKAAQNASKAQKAGKYLLDLGKYGVAGGGEAAIQGLGRSTEDTLSGKLNDAKDFAKVGAIAAPAMKVGMDLPGAAWDVSKKLPLVGNITQHIEDVFKEGRALPNVSLENAAQGANKAVSENAQDLNNAGVKVNDDMERLKDIAKRTTGKNLQNRSVDLQTQLSANKREVGRQIGDQWKVIRKAVGDEIPTESQPLMDFMGELVDQEGPVSKAASKIRNRLGERPTLNSLQDTFNALEKQIDAPSFEALDYDAKRGIRMIQRQIKDTIDASVESAAAGNSQLAGNVAKLKELNPQYSKMLIAEEKLFGGVPDMRNGAEMPMNASQGVKNMQFLNKSPAAIDTNQQVDILKNLGRMDSPVSEVENAAKQYQKFNVDKPALGEMGFGPDEQTALKMNKTFDKPVADTPSSSLNKTLTDFSTPASTPEELQNKETVRQIVKDLYGDKADDFLAELQNNSARRKTLEGGLEHNFKLNQDFTSWLRSAKKLSDPLAYRAGQMSSKLPAKATMDKLSTMLGKSVAIPTYKDAVESFKNSQNPALNGGQSEEQ